MAPVDFKTARRWTLAVRSKRAARGTGSARAAGARSSGNVALGRLGSVWPSSVGDGRALGASCRKPDWKLANTNASPPMPKHKKVVFINALCVDPALLNRPKKRGQAPLPQRPGGCFAQ